MYGYTRGHFITIKIFAGREGARPWAKAQGAASPCPVSGAVHDVGYGTDWLKRGLHPTQ